MPYFQPFQAHGLDHDLSHLDPFVFGFQSEKVGRRLQIQVFFTSHCFSVDYQLATHPVGSEIIIDGGGKRRSFCSKRYALSLHLPNAIRNMAHEKVRVYQSIQERNWVYALPVETGAGTYYAFFQVRRAGSDDPGDLKMTIESAYPWDAANPRKEPGTKGKMGFFVLCSKVHLGEPLSTRR